MKQTEKTAEPGFERLMGMFNWWGIPKSPGASPLDQQMQRLHAFATEVQELYRQTYNDQMEIATDANQRIIDSMQELLRTGRQEDLPRRFIDTEVSILRAMTDVASAQLKSWTEFAQHMQTSYAQLAFGGLNGQEPVRAPKTAASAPLRAPSKTGAAE